MTLVRKKIGRLGYFPMAWAGSHPPFFVLGMSIVQSTVATAHTENSANRFWPTPVAPFSRYRAQAQSGSNRLVVEAKGCPDGTGLVGGAIHPCFEFAVLPAVDTAMEQPAGYWRTMKFRIP